MTDARIRASIEAYVAAWNEHDATKRMQLIEQACAEDVHLRTPGKPIDGRQALDALMVDFQKRRPGSRAVFSSGIDIQGSVFRYTGVAEDSAGARGGEAFDAGECDEEGRIRFLLSFVGTSVPSQK